MSVDEQQNSVLRQRNVQTKSPGKPQDRKGLKATFAKRPQDQWEKKELLLAIHWIRQLVGLVLGVAWGVIPMKGAIGNISFGILNALVVFLYYSKYLEIDEEEFGGHMEFLSEGFMPSYALFVVCWTVVYSLMHF